MRIKLNNNSLSYDLNSVTGIDGRSTARVIDDAGEPTTITPFEEMLNSRIPEVKNDSSYDNIVQASELSVEELTELYLRLGIKSAAGDKAESITYNESLMDANCDDLPFKVPDNMKSIFEEASQKYGVDYKLLVSVASAESDFNPACTSKSGAMGVMQLMPATAKYLGVTDAYDAKSNIMGGARYLSEKLKEHGSVKLGIAAYNAGSNAVKKYGGVPPYNETQNYVKKILGYIGTDGSESGLISQAEVSDSYDTIDDSITVKVGDNSMTYSSYLRYISLLE